MNTVYEFGDNRKTAMPSDDLIDVDIEDYMGGEQGPDPDSQSGHAESDLPDEVPADDDNAGKKPAFSETGWATSANITHIVGGRYEYRASDGALIVARQTPMQDWETWIEHPDGTFSNLNCETKNDVNFLCKSYESGASIPREGFVTRKKIYSHGNLAPAESARLRKFRNAVKKNVRSGKVKVAADAPFFGLTDGPSSGWPPWTDGRLEGAIRAALEELSSGNPSGKDVAARLGKAFASAGGYTDSIDRERAFSLAAEATGLDYDDIYYGWLHGPANWGVQASRRRGSRRTAGYPEGTYEGWANYATWNVALWINNDEGLYYMAKEYDDYESFAEASREYGMTETPDGVALNDSGLDIAELDEMFEELRSEGRRRFARRGRRAVRKTADLDVRMMLTSDLGFAVRDFVRDEMSDGMSETQYTKAMWDFALTQATSNEDAIKRAQVVLNDLVHGGYDNANEVQAELYEYLQENGIDDEWDRLQREWKAYLRQARTGSRKVARRPFVGSRGGQPRRGMSVRGSRDSYDAGFQQGVQDAENRRAQLEFTIDADPDFVSGYYDAYEAYGFDKLPDDFDTWNSVDKDEYLNDMRLRGYGSRKRSARGGRSRGARNQIKQISAAKFDTSEYINSHGKPPSGRGGWAFTPVLPDGITSLPEDRGLWVGPNGLEPDMVWASAPQTLTDAKREVAQAYPEVKQWSVLP
jgi:hypothetical protein